MKNISSSDFETFTVKVFAKLEQLGKKIEDLSDQESSPSPPMNDLPIGLPQLLIMFPQLKRGYVYDQTSRHKIPHYKAGKRLQFIPSEITAWLTDGNRQLTNI